METVELAARLLYDLYTFRTTGSYGDHFDTLPNYQQDSYRNDARDFLIILKIHTEV